MLTALLMMLFMNPANAYDCKGPIQNDCRFYSDCVASVIPCGESGYAEAYGRPYCEKFTASQYSFPRGVAWRNATRKCLQASLQSYLMVGLAVDVTCESIKDNAFDSHPHCYVAPDPTHPELSICSLSRRDQLTTLNVIQAGDLIRRRGRKQIIAVAKSCVKLLSEHRHNKDLSGSESDLLFWGQLLLDNGADE